MTDAMLHNFGFRTAYDTGVFSPDYRESTDKADKYAAIFADCINAPKCGNCACFQSADDHGVGTCTGFEKENWSYANCGAFCCEHYKAVQE